MKKIVGVLLSVLLVIASYLLLTNYNESHGLEEFEQKKTSMYLWNIDTIDYSSFDKVVDYLNIDTLYVGSYGDFESYKHTLLFGFAQDNNLTSYIVYGEKIASIKDIKKLMDQVVEYNNNHEYQITGLAIDSEFHTTSEYRNADAEGKKAIFRHYVDIMEEAYAYARENGLKYVSCIPVSYDSISEELLEELIKDGCDYVQIMNYNKKGKITKIEKEVEIAKKYNKPIESIAELLPPGYHDVTDAITFWNEGLDACTDSFREIYDYYQYDKMRFAYHYINPVLDLAKDVIDLSNEFNYELYPKDSEGNTTLINDVYLVNGDTKIKGLNVYDKKSKEYLIYFYNVSYDKEYTLVVNGYEINNTKVSYSKSEDRIKFDERVFTVKEEQEEPEEPEQPVEDEPTTPDIEDGNGEQDNETPKEETKPEDNDQSDNNEQDNDTEDPSNEEENSTPEQPVEDNQGNIEDGEDTPSEDNSIQEEVSTEDVIDKEESDIQPNEEYIPKDEVIDGTQNPPYTNVEIDNNVEDLSCSVVLFLICLSVCTLFKSLEIEIK